MGGLLAAQHAGGACLWLHLLSPVKGAGLPPAAPDARIAWPALDAATQANLWPTKSAITSMPARDADVMALAFNVARADKDQHHSQGIPAAVQASSMSE